MENPKELTPEIKAYIDHINMSEFKKLFEVNYDEKCDCFNSCYVVLSKCFKCPLQVTCFENTKKKEQKTFELIQKMFKF